MSSYILISIISGLLFAVLDGIINANPLAQRLYQVYTPIAKKSVNFIAGMVIDLIFGFAMTGAFLLLYQSLPGDAGIIKGLSYAVLMWFFRVVMSIASQWMMYTVPLKTLLYSLIMGLAEMLLLGVLYGLALKPAL